MKSVHFVMAESEAVQAPTSSTLLMSDADDCTEYRAASYGRDFLHTGCAQGVAHTLANTERAAYQGWGDYLVALATLCYHDPANHASCFTRTEDRSLELNDP
jgi:hypothetical protein